MRLLPDGKPRFRGTEFRVSANFFAVIRSFLPPHPGSDDLGASRPGRRPLFIRRCLRLFAGGRNARIDRRYWWMGRRMQLSDQTSEQSMTTMTFLGTRKSGKAVLCIIDALSIAHGFAAMRRRRFAEMELLSASRSQ